MDKKTMELRMQQWLPIFEAQAKSGLTKDRWCEENGIRRWEFFTRQRQIRKYLLNRDSEGQTESATSLDSLPSFVELPVDNTEAAFPPTPISQSPANGRIGIKYRGFSVELQGRVDAATLDTLIRSLSHV